MKWQIFFVSIIALSLSAAALAESARPAEIAVVRNWDQLMQQPAQELGDGLVVRLGIERNEQAANDGVLLYCLVNDASKVKPPEVLDVLGPLAVSVTDRDRPPPAGHVIRRMTPKLPDRPALYAVSVPVHDEAAAYEITLSAAEGRAIARTTLKAAGELAHPWVAFGPSRELQEMRQRRPDDRADDVTSVHFGMPDGGPALPHWGGELPVIVLDEVQAPDPAAALPALLPREPDAGLLLQRDGDTLQITSDAPLAAHPFAEDRWLARWWINGEPFAGSAFEPERLSRMGGIAIASRHIDIELEFDAAAIGADPGDRIGVQLLYCAQGWDHVGDRAEHLLPPHMPGESDPPPVRMSNRIEFVAP